MSHIRERWVYRTDPDTGECIKFRVDPGADQPVAKLEISTDRHYENTCATDGTDIGSRRKCNEYMRLNGLTRPDDFKEFWAKKAEERAAYHTQGGTPQEHRERREAIGRAMYQYEQRRRR